MKKLIINLAILVVLLITACKEAEKKAPVKPDYDFRDEQYQDFYSQYMRQRIVRCKAKCLSNYFNSQKLQEELGINNISKNAVGSIIIDRIDPENDTVIRDSNHFQNKEDVIAYYQQKSLTNNRYTTEPCSHREQVEGLFCLRNKTKIRYFYLPQEFKQLPYLEQSINFYCMPITKPITESICKLSNHPNKPFNLDVWAKFSNPYNFFYVMPYAEKLIFNSTGEHIWQTSAQAKAVNP